MKFRHLWEKGGEVIGGSRDGRAVCGERDTAGGMGVEELN